METDKKKRRNLKVASGLLWVLFFVLLAGAVAVLVYGIRHYMETKESKDWLLFVLSFGLLMLSVVVFVYHWDLVNYRAKKGYIHPKAMQDEPQSDKPEEAPEDALAPTEEQIAPAEIKEVPDAPSSPDAKEELPPEENQKPEVAAGEEPAASPNEEEGK